MEDHPKSDVIYFNAAISNNKNVPIQARYIQNRSQNIVDRASDYYMAITRFDVPHDDIAIFNFNQDDYFVTIGNKTEQLVYVDQGNPFTTLDARFQGIYTFQQFLDSINNAFTIAHNTAPASPGNPPRVVLEEDGRFSFQIDELYTESIFLNEKLRKFFISINGIFLSYTDPIGFEVLYGPVVDNLFPYEAPLVGNYYKMLQETKSQFEWSNIIGIVITTTSMPCIKEYVGNLTGIDSSTEVQAVTDFIPIQNAGESYDRSNWIYNSGSGYRLVQLQSDSALRNIDFVVQLVNRAGFLFPSSISPGSSASVKFMFIKKELENSAVRK